MIVSLLALPNMASRDVRNFFTPATWAGNALRPTKIGKEINAVIHIGEVFDRFGQGLRECDFSFMMVPEYPKPSGVSSILLPLR